MKPMKAFLLSFFTLAAIGMWGLGIYTAGAGSAYQVDNGYGVVATQR